MPLKPIDPATGAPKKITDYSEEELRHYTQQVAQEQLDNSLRKAAIDHAALDAAHAAAKKLGAQDLIDQVQSTKDHIKALYAQPKA